MTRKSKPITAITYAEVRRMVADDQPALLAAADRLITASLLLAPAVLGPLAVPLLGLFDLKSDAVRLAGDLARGLARRGEGFLHRSESLAAAHLLITHTAFWAAADGELGELLRAGDGPETRESPDVAVPAAEEAYAGLPPVSLPHPAARFADEDQQRLAMYTAMAARLAEGARDLGEWERERLRAGCAALPELAMRHYYAQYLDLMLTGRDFFAWAAAYEHAKTQALVVEQTAAIDSRLGLVLAAVEGVDVGLRRLAAALSAPAGQVHTEVTTALALAHERQALEPVVVDEFETLRYPARIDAFVPQPYRELRYPAARVSLEDERLWAARPYRDDIAAAMVLALESAYSVTAPLLVLGHPGSGKSLLTQVLAARLSAVGHHVVRLELRDATPGTPVQTQIEEQIRRDCGHDVNWAEFGRALAGRPVLVILDGYDELLQANGQVFADYLQQVHAFQRRELDLDRPVRMLVTSRVTLIDKAVVPPGTAVLRLAEFDHDRQITWARQWNDLNAGHFHRTGVRPFTPPAAPGLRDLAGQPLLLLLLAIYDSQANQLADTALDRSSLYHSLLRRFVERELTKGAAAAAAFHAAAETDRRAAVERELDRLGLAALGMFNRRAVHISRADLDADLAYHRALRRTEGGTLSPADAVLGSFFFIHESRSRSGDPDDSSRGAAASFEFLHNTFGEFLTADLILRRVILLAAQIHVYRTSPLLAGDLEAKLADPGDEWYAALAFEALHHRPLVAQMLREWLPHRLAADGLDPAGFASALHALVDRQLALVLHASPPRWFTDGAGRAPYPGLPLLGSLAVYSLNLVVVAAVLDRLPVSDLAADDATSDWARLTSLWRSWFPSKSLVGLVGVLHGARSPGVVEFTRATGVEYGGPEVVRDAVYEAAVVAVGLADDLTAGLATLVIGRSEPDGRLLLQRSLDFLDRAGFDTRWERIAQQTRETGVLPAIPVSGSNAALAEACALGQDRELPRLRLTGSDAPPIAAVTWVKAIADPAWRLAQMVGSPPTAPLLRSCRHIGWAHPFEAPGGADFGTAVEYALLQLLIGDGLEAADALVAERIGAAGALAGLPEDSWLALLRALDRFPRTAAALAAGAGRGDRRILTRFVLDPQAADVPAVRDAANRASTAVHAVLLHAARRHDAAGMFARVFSLGPDTEAEAREVLGLPRVPSAADPDVLGDLAWLREARFA
ncbi:ATP-binding protein [Dactylosporangium sp. NPDC049140]|uniref:NACHT domain-containing protein n=1 Tax=Dactylosporangium sp. NPDC049140 TaxID=3155647 RepID=UPI0033ED61EB